MASLASLIDGYDKSPSVTVRFNGNRIRDLAGVTVNLTLDGGVGSASIRTLSNPGTQPEARVLIQQGYNGNERQVFTGYIDTIERDEASNTYTINCRDVLKKALDTFLVQEIKFGQDLAAGQFYYSTYTDIDGGTFTIHQYSSLAALNAAHPETTGNYTSQGVYAEAVVQWLLHMSGLAEGKEIQVDSSNFFIGDLNPAKFHLTSVYDAAMQIANLIGWRIYADATGVARFKRKPRQPGGYSSWNYSDKTSTKNINKFTRTVSNIDLRNYVEVRGASGIRTVLRSPSPYIGNTPYRGVLISEELIDTQGIADFTAARVLGDLNRLKVTVTLEADGNPFLVAGSTINVNASAAIERKYLVETIQQSLSEAGYKLSATASAYLGDTRIDEDITPDIVAAFVPTFVSILGDPKYIVDFDAAGSYSDRGLITRFLWSWPDSSTTDSADSTSTFVFDSANIDNGNSQNVTLQVWDSIGNTASVTNPITGSGLLGLVDPKYRQLYGAMTTVAVGSLDGGQSWTQYPLPAISVAASNFAAGGVYVTSGHALFGTSDGKIYKTVDCCTTMTLVNSPGGEVTDIAIPELDSSKAAAVTSTGKVLYSDTGGDTWRQIGTFAFPLRQVKVGFTDFRYVEIVGSGVNRLYETFDTGGTWNRIANSLDILWATDGSATNYYAHTAGVYNGSTAASITGVSSPVPAATVMIDRDDGVMAVDSAGQHWVAAAGVFSATQNSPANLTRHMIRDGEMAIVGYYATQSGVYKSVDRNETTELLHTPTGSLPTGGWGKKVAYGPLAAAAVPGTLVFRGTTSPGGNGWHIATTSGWRYGTANVAGPAAITTAGIAVGRVNANTVDYIECVVSSGTVAGIGALVTHTDWVTLGGGRVHSMSFNNRPDLRDQLVMTTVEPTFGNNQLYAENILNFTTDPLLTTSDSIAGPGFARHGAPMYMASLRGELLDALNYTFFSLGPVYSIFYDADGGMTTTTHTGTSIIMQFGAFYKASTDWKSVIADPSDTTLLVGGYSSGFITDTLSIPVTSIITLAAAGDGYAPLIFGSVVDQSRMYYATASGFYYADGYGQGASTLLLASSAVANGVITWAGVNYANTNTADYICVIVREGVAGANSRAFYSTDSGDTFQQGPELLGNSGGGELYFLDLT